MLRAARAALLIAIAGGGLFYFRDHVRTFALQAYVEIAPCTVPITYSIENIDPRFGISTSSLSQALVRASGVWNEEAGKELFRSVDSAGAVHVRLEYDRRQKTTEELRELGSEVDKNLDTYETLKAQYERAYESYISARARFDARYAAYEDGVAAYERDVRRWNARGGAPASAYEQMEARQRDLEAESSELRAQQDALRAAANEVNDLARQLNALAQDLNISVSAYNTVGERISGEFEEALYESRPGLQTITVYEYGSSDELVRVLAHEFGHALGLEHVDEKGAIMYRLNEGELVLAEADKTALRTLCRAR